MRNIFFMMVLAMFMTSCGCSTVDPGERAIKITMGKPDQEVHTEGLVFHLPFVTHLERVNIQQRTAEGKTQSFSFDNQTVDFSLAVRYRLPEAKIYSIITEYKGSIFDSVINPNVQEALKQHTSAYTAENMIKNREELKLKALDTLRKKVGDIAIIEDLIIQNIDLSDELEKAIESKMVQQQEAAKAVYLKEKAKTEAETALIKAQGEANAMNVRGKALKENAGLVELIIAERWDGKTPLVVGGGKGANVLLPLSEGK